jgi:hypothetical protein
MSMIAATAALSAGQRRGSVMAEAMGLGNHRLRLIVILDFDRGTMLLKGTLERRTGAIAAAQHSGHNSSTDNAE